MLFFIHHQLVKAFMKRTNYEIYGQDKAFMKIKNYGIYGQDMVDACKLIKGNLIGFIEDMG